MKIYTNIALLFLMIFSSNGILAQKDSIALQRKARKMVRQGNQLYQQQQYTDASVAYRKALDKSSNYDKASYNLGNALYENKNFKEAAPQYELSAKTAEDKFTKAEAYHNLGNSMMETKNYQGAVDAFKNSLRNNPNDDETRYNLAVAQELLDKEKEENKDDKNKDKKDQDKKDKDDKNKDEDKKEGDDNKDKKNDEDKDGKGDEDKKDNQDPKKEDAKDQQEKPKPQQGKMSPQQVKQLLESLSNEEKKTQKKMNAQKAKGKKVKQEKDW
ncbi:MULTISPECIES: tetratricopeptide repeat protein [unclassified Polaribacter]|uniref:tetratricopeptide repeat protein n=1 Tax=unclassified Polaribacter TaxID=196858 RepID=UPI0011BF30EC|nr:MULTISPECIES: tetratricopeptide repeat protein [unclassified Polaribacter]TXD53497.1 tetratricopeptide repeat protein [Polaribacter sp. IC063]TXD58356.1 tetratricopeptide repeat protein [Polaribacter sp. IC066]